MQQARAASNQSECVLQKHMICRKNKNIKWTRIYRHCHWPFPKKHRITFEDIFSVFSYLCICLDIHVRWYMYASCWTRYHNSGCNWQNPAECNARELRNDSQLGHKSLFLANEDETVMNLPFLRKLNLIVM